jgi:predicted  nucleic acid-binding Zn-ribbon protein
MMIMSVCNKQTLAIYIFKWWDYVVRTRRAAKTGRWWVKRALSKTLNAWTFMIIEGRLETALAEASVMKSRAEDLDSTLDQTTKAGNAVCVTNVELRGELDTLQASYRVLVEEVEEYEQELVRGRSALAEVEKELTRAQTRVRELEQRLEKATKEGAALKTSKDELQATVASMREQGGYDKTRIAFMEEMIAAGDSSKAVTVEVKRLEAARQLERDAQEACEREMATLRRDLENMTHMKNDLERQLETAQVEAGMMKGRAEDLDRTLDETTKAHNAALVKYTELKCQQLMVRRIRNSVTAKVIETWRMKHAEATHLRHLKTRAVIMSRIRALVAVMIQWREHIRLSQMAVKARCRYMKRMLLFAWECWYKYFDSNRQAMVQLADQIKANAGMKSLSKMLRCIALKKWLNKSLCKTWQRWLNVLLERKLLSCIWSAVLRRRKQRVSTGPCF